MLNPIRIEDRSDPRIAGFMDIRERDLTGRDGLFVAEGEVVLRTFLSPACRCRAISVLIAENRLRSLSSVLESLPGRPPVHVAPQSVLDSIAGFHLHRGILALGRKPVEATPEAILDDIASEAVLVAAAGIGNHDNLGGLYRNAAAFGAAAVLLDDRCGDPFYRKSIRTSVGAVLRVPTLVSPLGQMLDALQNRDIEVLALTPGGKETVDQVERRGPVAVLLGSEGPGLPQDVLARCRPVAIRMSGDFDSLNVATAAAVALHQLSITGLSGC